MDLSCGFAALKIDADVLGHRSVVYPSFFWDGPEAVLVDTAFPGTAGQIVDEVRKSCAASFSIVVTHQDIDHIGGGEAIVAALDRDVRIFAHELDAPYIRGEKLILKLAALGDAGTSALSIPEGIPEEKKNAFLAALRKPPALRVTDELAGSGPFRLPGGLVAFHTPGHTPGHISLFHEASGTLAAGDLFFAVNGELRLCDPALCSDPEQNCASASSLASALRGADIRRIVCYHGGVLECGSRGEGSKMIESFA